jgi:hypothetical protein
MNHGVAIGSLDAAFSRKSSFATQRFGSRGGAIW